MQRTRGVVIIAVVAALAGFLSAGCGPTEGQRAQNAAREFVSAMQDDDGARVERTLTTAARERMGGDLTKKTGDKSDGASGYAMGEATVDGDKASVRVTLQDGDKSEPGKILLRRENHEWKVYAMAFPSPTGGADVTMDFERPEAILGDAFREFGRAAGLFASGMASAADGFAKGFEEGMKRAGEQAKQVY